MDLDLTPEQQQLVEAVRGFLSGHCPPDIVRAAEPGGFDTELWAVLAGLVGPAAGVPESLGGGGASVLDLELVAEQIGHFLAPVPFVDAAVAARLLAVVGETGRTDLDLVIDEPATVATVAVRPAIAGVAPLVPSGAAAGIVVAMDSDELVVVRGGTDEAVRANLGSSPVADRSVRVPDRAVLSEGTAARRAFEHAVDEWRVLTSGALVGLGEAALAIGVDYAKTRHQFGVPIGSFQSIARDLADSATLVDGARLLAREAAWAHDEEDQDFPSLAAMAFLFATRAARHTSRVALHVHGGYGFTLEYDIQLYYRRAQSWPMTLGDPRRGVSVLADALFGTVEVVA